MAPQLLPRTETAKSLYGEKLQSETPVLSFGKMILHSILLLLLCFWWDLLGLWLLPLYLYVIFLLLPMKFGRWTLKERMEVRSVIILYYAILSLPVLTVWCLTRGGLMGRAFLAVYMTWAWQVDDAPQRGGRFIPALRKRLFWAHFSQYFPMMLTRSEDLDPTRNYIFGYHPHGIISLGALCNFATDATGFSELFPGVDLRLLTLAMNFRVPFFREYLLGMGINDVSRKSCEQNLSRGPGASIMIVVGGARESLETRPGHADLVLGDRKGFVKMALRKGASIVPVFSFGENDVFGIYHSKNLTNWQLYFQKKLGFAVPLFFGRALTGGLLHRIFGLDVGVMPLRVPIHSVVGRAVHLEKVENPSQEQVDAAHTRYLEELKTVYEDWKDTYAKQRAEALAKCDPERQKVLENSKFQLHDIGDLSLVD